MRLPKQLAFIATCFVILGSGIARADNVKTVSLVDAKGKPSEAQFGGDLDKHRTFWTHLVPRADGDYQVETKFSNGQKFDTASCSHTTIWTAKNKLIAEVRQRNGIKGAGFGGGHDAWSHDTVPLGGAKADHAEIRAFKCEDGIHLGVDWQTVASVGSSVIQIVSMDGHQVKP